MKTSTMKTCMMTGKMCMCKSMDMCFVMKKEKLRRMLRFDFVR